MGDQPYPDRADNPAGNRADNPADDTAGEGLAPVVPLNEETGEDSDDDPLARTALPPRLEAWRKRSATGAILTGFALGLKEALDPHKQEPAIVMETSGEPPTDLPVEAEVDQIRPADNVVTIRPWLLPPDQEPPTS